MITDALLYVGVRDWRDAYGNRPQGKFAVFNASHLNFYANIARSVWSINSFLLQVNFTFNFFSLHFFARFR